MIFNELSVADAPNYLDWWTHYGSVTSFHGIEALREALVTPNPAHRFYCVVAEPHDLVVACLGLTHLDTPNEARLSFAASAPRESTEGLIRTMSSMLVDLAFGSLRLQVVRGQLPKDHEAYAVWPSVVELVTRRSAKYVSTGHSWVAGDTLHWLWTPVQ